MKMCALKVPIVVQTSWRNLLRVKNGREREGEKNAREREIVGIIIVIYYVEYEGNERVKVRKQNKQVGEFIFNAKYDGEREREESKHPTQQFFDVKSKKTSA